jgi:hypothetical protein
VLRPEIDSSVASRFELWKHALLDLERAIAELDQVHATLKDVRLEDVDAGGFRKPTIKDLVIDAGGLLQELQSVECDECGHAIAKHGDRYGCEYERGDVPMTCRDGGTVMAAAGPCGCRWGLEAIPSARALGSSNPSECGSTDRSAELLEGRKTMRRARTQRRCPAAS